MRNVDSLLDVQVWGEFACFTRPELKVERVTYPMMTPSAARGVLEAIFWKPEIAWRVREIWVLRPIRYFSVLRNEVNSRASARRAQEWQTQGGGYNAAADRAQRHTLALRDVAYCILAELVLNPHATEPLAKYRAQFRRRVAQGQCFATPYFGCREFTAAFGPVQPDAIPCSDLDGDLGPMVLDIIYPPDTSGQGAPRFFPAKLEHGILRIPRA